MKAAEMQRERAVANTIEMKLEVVVIPVSDVDRAKRFYSDLGWRLDVFHHASAEGLVSGAAEALGGLSTQFKRAALSMLNEGRNAC
jgi:catechol 2,3-dioxygenase-like lactoylglutathione lyase family enzyme